MNIYQNSFINELLTPFLPYLDTQHLICEIFILFVGGSQGVPKYLKIILTRDCKKNF